MLSCPKGASRPGQKAPWTSSSSALMSVYICTGTASTGTRGQAQLHVAACSHASIWRHTQLCMPARVGHFWRRTVHLAQTCILKQHVHNPTSIRPSAIPLAPRTKPRQHHWQLHPSRTFMGGRVPLTTTGTSAACHCPTAIRMGRVWGAAHTCLARTSRPVACMLPMVEAICSSSSR
jgi:hypothetical protein